jgi:epoxyqueuosine reductase
VRNAALALGNSGNGEFRSDLERLAAEDPDPVVRDAADWALTRLPAKSSSGDANAGDARR